jgi:lycopene beta-cyclase
MTRFDYLLVGGGLQNALITEALLQLRPGARVGVIERGTQLGGNHTWCFHAADVPADATGLVEPFVVERWARQSVSFPTLERTLEEPYAALSSESVHRVLAGRAANGELSLHLGARAVRIGSNQVELESGTCLEAQVVIDARGPDSAEQAHALGFQKFVGLELEVRPGSGPSAPVLMDACVEQTDGFRFVYLLPFGRDRLLVEDTYFSDTPALDIPALRAGITRYAASRGIEAYRVLREEAGVLPLPGRAPLATPARNGRFRGGYAGGWFHPATGYSFPLALRYALAIAKAEPSELGASLDRLALRELPNQRFAALLNRLLFRGLAPAQRYSAFERFYRLPVETIRRFYAHEATALDRTRIVCGRPPRGFSLTRLFSGQRSDTFQGERT